MRWEGIIHGAVWSHSGPEVKPVPRVLARGGDLAMRIKMAALAALALTIWAFPVGAQLSQGYARSHGRYDDKVAVIRCDTALDGTIRVRNSSVTSATGVSVQRGDRCAATISAFLRAGLRILYGPQVTTNSTGSEVSFNFVFISCSDDGDDDDDDCDDDDD